MQQHMTTEWAEIKQQTHKSLEHLIQQIILKLRNTPALEYAITDSNQNLGSKGKNN